MVTDGTSRPLSGRSSVRFLAAMALLGGALLIRLMASWHDSAPSHRPSPKTGGAPTARDTLASTRQARDLPTELQQREGRVTTTQPSTGGRAQAPSGAVREHERPAEEVEREIRHAHFRRLDGLLNTEAGDALSRSAEAAARRELTSALGATGHVTDLKCATEFCRIEIEDGGEDHQIDFVNLLMNVPSLRNAALWDHEQRGAVKRTIIYVARSGRDLPLPQAGVAESSRADTQSPP